MLWVFFVCVLVFIFVCVLLPLCRQFLLAQIFGKSPRIPLLSWTQTPCMGSPLHLELEQKQVLDEHDLIISNKPVWQLVTESARK